MFGIGLPDKSVSSFGSSMMKFRLYPKNLTDVTYNSKVLVSNERSAEVNLFYSGDKISEFGLMIKDKSCYEKMVNFFKSFNNDIFVDSISGNKVTSKVSLLGYVLNV